MKTKAIFILCMLCVCLAQSQSNCDTLKWKTRGLYHTYVGPSNWIIDSLDGKNIDIDIYSPCYLAYGIQNESQDTFYATEKYAYYIYFCACTDTGRIYYFYNYYKHTFDFNVAPKTGFINQLPVLDIYPEDWITIVEENCEISRDKIDHWEMDFSVYWSSRDGDYSDSIVELSRMVAKFNFIKGNNIASAKNNGSLLVFPVPTSQLLSLDNGTTLIKEVFIYDCMGKEMKKFLINNTHTELYIQDLPNGIYIIKCICDQGIINRKIHILK